MAEESEGGVAGELMAMAFGYRLPRCLHIAVELGVPEAIGDTPVPIQVLATQVGAKADALQRVLLALASAGVFERTAEGFAHTASSRLLRADQPGSVAGFIRFAGCDYQWATWGALEHSARTGEPGFDHIYGCNTFQYYQRRPDHGRVFDQAMTSKAMADIAAVTEAYDVSPFRTIADIGGGRGHLLRGVLQASPQTAGVLFDMPDVVENARTLGEDRIRFVGGDFFNDDMPAADAYLMMMVLHDWTDEACVRILSNLRRTAPQESRLLVIEAVLPEEVGGSFARLADVHMMVLTGGRERTQAQYADLLEKGGWRLVHDAIPTATDMLIVEAAPA